MRIHRSPLFRAAPVVAAALAALAGAAQASSHREAPFITTEPKVDASDFYMFNSYETGRGNYVTLIANYQPLQDAYDGPNYHTMDANALYEIHVDNNGDGVEDLTFQFRFTNALTPLTVPVGDTAQEIAPMQNGTVSVPHDPHLQVNETYTVTLVRGDRRTGTTAQLSNATGGATTFDKPFDNIGEKTIPNYPAYAAAHIYTVNIPGCSAGSGRVFVGQRQDPFAVNLGVIFDSLDAPTAIITDPTKIGASVSSLDQKNVTTLALEIPKSCLLAAGTTPDPVIGGWTTASLRQTRVLDPTPKAGFQTPDRVGGAWTQVSRLGMPLVNELVIGLKDKDRFNGSKPKDDAQFLSYVTNPSYPKLLETYDPDLVGASPTNIPRNDLVTTFLTGITGVNKPANVVPAEELRLNTSIAAVPFANQNRLGIVGNILSGGSDSAGYPNGRRPKDDVVDISLVVVEGGLCVANGTTDALGFGAACNPSAVPLGSTVFNLNDTVDQATRPFLAGFPYLNTPVPGTGALATTAAAAKAKHAK